MDYVSLDIASIRRGDLFWECEGGQDALFIATSDARRDRNGIVVEGRGIPDGKPCRFFEADRGGAYGPRLYRQPEYTRPDWPALLTGLAAIMREELAECAAQANAREAGLQTAATEYSKSRDRWMTEARAAQEEIKRLRSLVDDMLNVTRQNLNGITMGRRIQAIVEARDA
jgi:hypothetical protein